MSTEKGVKLDGGKPMMNLIYWPAVIGIAEVLTFGAKKYTADGWQTLPDRKNRYFAATMRHLLAYWSGERVDPESGLSHLDHVATNIMFLKYDEARLLEIEQEKVGVDFPEEKGQHE